MRRPPPASHALLGCLLLCLLTTRATCQCELAFTVNPELSALTFGGGVLQPLAAPLVPTHPEALVGLQGAVTAILTGACPTTAEALLAQLAGARFETSAKLGPLELYPAFIEASAGKLATIAITDAAVNLTTAPLAASAAAPAAGGSPQYTSSVDAAISQGTALVTAPLLSATPITVDLAGMAAGNATQVSAALQGEQVRVRVQGLYLAFPYTLQVEGSPLTAVINVVLQGSLVLDAVVGCPADCGPHGRCWADGNGTAAAAAAAPATPTCVCECGWEGAACKVPSGYCARFPAESDSLATCPAAPAAASPSPAAAPQLAADVCPPCLAAEDCNPRQYYSAADSTCTCLPGWSGPDCGTCDTSSACVSYYGVDSATCSGGVTYSSLSQYKVYTCEMEGLESLLQPAFHVTCNSSAPAEGDSLSGRYCEFKMELKNGGGVTCMMSECSFNVNATRIDCAKTHCECDAACPDFEPLVAAAEGQPVVIDCDASTAACYVDIKDFLVVLKGTCTAAECLVAGYSLDEGAAADEGTYSVPSNSNANAIIAAVPVMALVLMAALLSFLLFTHRAHWAAMGKAAPASVEAAGDGVAVATAPGGAVVQLQMQASDTIQELRFEQLYCAVPLRRGSNSSSGFAAAFRRSTRQGASVPGTGSGAGEKPASGLGGKAGWDEEAAAATKGAGGGSSCGTGMKELLKGVSGMAKQGELVGVLGPSGCGKTTMLALVAGSSEYVSAGAHVEGAVLLDGALMSSQGRRKVAFVPEDDTLLATLTVAECISYRALLRLPTHLTSSEVQAQVSRVIDELGLRHVAGSRVGGQGGRGVSGGERRRVAIGQELVADPAILVLDEPTSSLDSYTALHLMRTLKQVAGAGRIVMLSFHQPSPAMFNLLDRAYLLAAGSLVYTGPPSGVGPHFAAHGLPCPAGSAIAEHMLEVVSDPALLSQMLLHSSQEPALSLKTLTPNTSSSGSDGQEAPAAAVTAVAAQADPPVAPSAAVAEAVWVSQQRRRRSSRLGRELAVLFWRTLVDILRNPSLLLLHWGLALGMGLLMGAIFFGVGLDMSGVQNRGGGVYFSLAFFAFTSLTTTDLLTAERRLVVREVRGGCYSASSYLLCKALLDGLLLRVIPVFLYSAPFYPMMGLQSGSTQVALFLMTLSTYALAVAALSLAVTVGCNSAGKASLFLTSIFLVSLLVGGFLVNVESIPSWIGWLHYFSLFYYAYVILTTNEVATLSMSLAVKGYTAVSNVKGLAILDTFGIDSSKLTTWIIVMDCFYVACLLLAFALLYLRMPRPQALRRRRVAA